MIIMVAVFTQPSHQAVPIGPTPFANEKTEASRGKVA